MKTAIWIIFAVLAALWTGMAYASVEMLRWVAQLLSEGARAGSWLEWVTNWSVPSWMLIWVDAQQIQALQLALGRLAEQMQGSWPGLGPAVSWIVPLIWGLWALGVLLLLSLAALGHWLVRREVAPKPQAMPPAAA